MIRVKQEDVLRDGPGSQLNGSVLQFLITVIGDCLAFATLQRTSQVTNSGAQHDRHTKLQTCIFLPSRSSATLSVLPHRVTSSGGGEKICKCTLCGGVGGDGLLPRPPCWRREGLLHVVWEAEVKGSDTNLTRMHDSMEQTWKQLNTSRVGW